MDRLTKREILKTSNNEEFVGCNIEIAQMNSCQDCNDSCMYGRCKWQEKANRKLKEYEDLEERGLLHKAPFKIGQTIWIVGNELINDYVVRQFIVTEKGIEAVKVSKEINGREYWNTFYTESWLVSVFPTEAEAEKALEEMEK